MSHQPFEFWIFMQEDLPPEQTDALQEHLQSCEHCYGLAAAWRQVEPLVSNAQMIAPAPGFVERWELRLEKERLSIQRRQSLWVFAAGLGFALVSLVLLATVTLLSLNSPIEWFLALTSRVATLFYLADAIQNSFIILQVSIPLSWWIGAGLTIAALCILWIFSLQKLATRRIST